VKETNMQESLHIIEAMLKRRLKEQNKDASEAWIKQKALDIYDESKDKGEFIMKLEEEQ